MIGSAITVSGGGCRLCGGQARFVADRGDVVLYRCDVCGLVSSDPATAQACAAGYADAYDGPTPAAPGVRYAEWLAFAERTVGRGRLLEVGAGSGGFVSAALARGWRVDTTEVSPSALRRLGETGARVFAGDLADARHPAAAFDLVVCLKVVEHLASPMAHLAELSRVTRPGGLVLLSTPNFDGLSRRLLGLRWRVIAPEHLSYFTAGALVRALRVAGFAHVDVRSRSLDVTTWSTGAPRRFDPHAAARLREAVESTAVLALVKRTVNTALGISGLGDSLVAWGRR